MDKETLPEGTDAKELMSSKEIHDVPIVYNGKVWEFKFRELNWEENLDLVATMRNESTNMRTGITTTTTKYFQYMNSVYTKCCRGCPDGFMFRDCKPDFGNLIMKSIPGFSTSGAPDDLDEAEVKNS